MRIITLHTCALDVNRAEILQAVTTARQRAIQTQETSRQIISAATGPLTNEAKARFPRYSTIQRQLARNWMHVHMPYPNALTIVDINIPPALSITKGGAPFLLFDSGAADLD
uniref:Uncharacterized protein n=1 Tax=Romanomermis culicivorax TaxID=13658 RepID=A0A915HPR6_ROMCU